MPDGIPISHAVLRSLHRIHRQRNDLESQLRRGPRQIQVGQETISEATAALEHAQQTLLSAKMSADEKQLHLKSREERVEELKNRLNTAASNKEYQTIKDQIAADVAANGVLADEILEALDAIDTLELAAGEKKSELQQRQQEHEVLVKDVESKAAGLQSDLQRALDELALTEKELPSSALDQYRRLVTNAGEDAIASADGESCGCCGTTFNAQMMNQLMLSQLVACPSCAALLYLPE